LKYIIYVVKKYRIHTQNDTKRHKTTQNNTKRQDARHRLRNNSSEEDVLEFGQLALV
jgi:hypothetical protein